MTSGRSWEASERKHAPPFASLDLALYRGLSFFLSLIHLQASFQSHGTDALCSDPVFPHTALLFN